MNKLPLLALLFSSPLLAQFGNVGALPPSGGVSIGCTPSNGPSNGYVLTGQSSSTCQWATVGSASVDANTIKNAWVLTNTGSANAVTGTTTTTFPASYALGQAVIFQAAATNTGAATININSLGNKALTKGTTALAAGNLVNTVWYLAVYDSTEFQVVGYTLIAADVPTVNQNTTGYAAGLAAGSAGSLPYQTAANTTGFVAGNATGSTDAVLTSTASGGAYSSTSLKNAPALSAANMTSFPASLVAPPTNPALNTDSSLGTSTGSGFYLPGTSLTAGDLYYQASGGLTLAEANASTTVPAICIAISTTQCMTFGTYRFGSSQSWTSGQMLYVSDATAGAILNSAPTTSGHYVQVVGVALAADTVQFSASLDVGGIQ